MLKSLKLEKLRKVLCWRTPFYYLSENIRTLPILRFFVYNKSNFSNEFYLEKKYKNNFFNQRVLVVNSFLFKIPYDSKSPKFVFLKNYIFIVFNKK